MMKDCKFIKIYQICNLPTTSVIRGVGEYNINDPEDDDLSTPRSDPSSAVPYLLLDIRDQDDFEKCHIISG